MILRIAMVAGEASGDLLGAGLIIALKRRFPDATFTGIAGPRMIAAGCEAIFPVEKLSVMGLTEVLGHLPELFAIRKELRRRFRDERPDVFIGIDAPDFNLGLERQLKMTGIATVHYVSPSVWAWRQYRLRKIAQAVDLMLTLFPFEAKFYETHHVPVRYVGHSLADALPLAPDRAAARGELQLPHNGEVVAILPGSRMSEVRALGDIFIEAARRCAAARPRLHFVAPLATVATRALFEERVRVIAPQLPITIIQGRAHAAMTAADAVMVASGTATLEAMLLKCPLVMAYRLSSVTYWLAKRLVKVPYYSLPNLLAGRALVPEFIQDAATPATIAAAILKYLDDASLRAELAATFTEIHHGLRQDADERAAEAVADLLAQRRGAVLMHAPR